MRKEKKCDNFCYAFVFTLDVLSKTILFDILNLDSASFQNCM